MKEVGVGLLGFGTVGAGVVEALQKNSGIIAGRAQLCPVLMKIADLDLESDRGVEVDKSIMTSDAASVVDDPNVQVVVELIGGTTIAKDLTLRALKLGKPVVTANKAMLAEHGAELFAAARDAGTAIYFEAAVAGGIPIIRALTGGLVVNNVEAIHGILNGTCNYILTRMTREKLQFDDVLQEAQAQGFAEADPGLDIDGHDTAHKAAILASLAYGFHVPLDAMPVEGIRGIAAEDIEYASDLGYVIKLLAVIRQVGGEVEARVHPALVQQDHMLASVSGVFNAVMVKGDIVDRTLYYGRGAGRLPTASAVISDVVDAARSAASGADAAPCVMPPLAEGGNLRDSGKCRTRYYMRLALLDKPGSLAKICAVLGENGVSIASVMQKESQADERVPIIIITHDAEERQFAGALASLEEMDVVGENIVKIRIEDFEE